MTLKTYVIKKLLTKCNRGDLLDIAPEMAKLIASEGSINAAWTSPDVYEVFQENGVQLARNHFYSLLLDTRFLPNSHWPHDDAPDAQPYWNAFLHLNHVPYEQLLSEILSFSEYFDSVSCDQKQDGFYWDNPMFPPLDAVTYYGLIRALKPSKILEVGSGFSTMLAIEAAKHTSTKISCVEPFPGSHLLSLEGHLDTLHKSKVQDIPLLEFEFLEAGDILFFDGAHTCRLGSDSNHLLFNILPVLKKGVLVHIHDIFLPYEYPKRWYQELNIQWNEQYLVLAFLMNSKMFEVLLPNYLIGREQDEKLSKIFSSWDLSAITQNMGGINGASLWLRKL